MDPIQTSEADWSAATRRASMLRFSAATSRDYVAGAFQRALCGHLRWFADELEAQRSPRMILAAPVRHGKSFHVSERFPAWLMGRVPSRQVILASHTMGAAEKRSEAALAIMRSKVYHATFGTRLDPRHQTRREWKTSEGGHYLAVGSDGAGMGEGADVLVVDDPIKGPEQAFSQRHRDRVWDWYEAAGSTRLSRGGGILIMATRWHLDDLTGRILKRVAEGREPRPWRVVSMPAISPEGLPLDPVRWPLEELLPLREGTSPYWWASLYQQTPTADGGNIVKTDWIKRYEQPHARYEQIITSLDASGGSQTSSASRCALHVWGRHDAHFDLLERESGLWEMPELLERWDALVARRTDASAHLVENASNGRALIQLRQHVTPGVIPIVPVKSKVQRLIDTTPWWQAGNVRLPLHEPWAETFIGQVTTFPSSAYNDDVDACSQALTYLGHPHGTTADEWADVWTRD